MTLEAVTTSSRRETRVSKSIGRFEIRRELGRGAQSVVYLAWDPHLQREVAIKTLHFSRPSPEKNAQLLTEARTVSKLRHANLVTIFEAGEEDGDPYLVFEYIAGRSLAEMLRQDGPIAPAKATALMSQILEAVSAAHASSVIHRDLKPSNILIDESGVPRVMDFGIAVREIPGSTTVTGELVGTPAYLSPEYLNGNEVTQRSDVFAAGLVLHEMLTAKRAVPGSDPFQVMRHIAHEAIALPSGSHAVDDKLAAVLSRALAKDPQERFESAKQMKQALDAYLETPDQSEEGSAGGAGGKQATLDFLLRRMRHRGDFPALSESVGAINKITNSETDNLSTLSNTVLKDFALTNKILKLVNSAFYRPAGAGTISTVSRAVIVLGFSTIRNIAVTLLLFEHLQNKANASQLKEEFVRAALTGFLGRDLGAKSGVRDVEEVFICSMFHNLGRLLTQYYFPEENEEIRKVMQLKDVNEAAASAKILGLSFEELGIGVARTWGFPEVILGSLRGLPDGPLRKPTTHEGKLQMLSSMSDELCTVVADTPLEGRDQALKKVMGRFGGCVPLDEKQLQQMMERSTKELQTLASVVKINLQSTSFGRRVRAATQPSGTAVAHKADKAADTTIPGTVLGEERPQSVEHFEATETAAEPMTSAEEAKAVLSAGIQEISNALLEEFSLNDLLRIVLETMYRAQGFQRVILCIKDVKNNTMAGRFGFGPDVPELTPKFKFPLSYAPDVFHVSLAKNVDILISDTNDPKIKDRIPDWFRKLITAQSFVVFPLVIKEKPVALIYADKEKAGDIVVSEDELKLFRTLRNQALLAMKQRG